MAGVVGDDRGIDVTPVAAIASASGASCVTTSVFVPADSVELLLVVGRREHGVAATDEVEGAVVAEQRARLERVLRTERRERSRPREQLHRRTGASGRSPLTRTIGAPSAAGSSTATQAWYFVTKSESCCRSRACATRFAKRNGVRRAESSAVVAVRSSRAVAAAGASSRKPTTTHTTAAIRIAAPSARANRAAAARQVRTPAATEPGALPRSRVVTP